MGLGLGTIDKTGNLERIERWITTLLVFGGFGDNKKHIE